MLADENDCVEVSGLIKNYKNFTALNNITFNIKCGEKYSLLGPNGAGKSTTLKILAGLLKPDSGFVKIGGQDPTTVEAKKYIGYLPEDAYPYPNLSVISNLEYIGAIRGVQNLADRIDELFNGLDLRDYVNNKVMTLSRGNRQKVSVALAIIHNPKIVLLDEPLNYLDIPTQKKVITMLEKLNATILVSTHIMEIAERLSQNIIIINHGKITWTGTMDQLKSMITGDESIEDVVEKLMIDVF